MQPGIIDPFFPDQPCIGSKLGIRRLSLLVTCVFVVTRNTRNAVGLGS
ncbi:hypothetical protein [Spirosoma telluris]